MSKTIESRVDDPGRADSTPALKRFPVFAGEEMFLVEGSPEGPTNMEFEVRFAGSLDEAKLREALDAAVAAHPMLRARVASSRSYLRPPDWEVVESADAGGALEISSLDDGGDIDAVRAAFCNRPIDLRVAPAFRSMLVRRPGGDSLLLSVHHALTDGIGVMRLLNSMARSYDGGQPDPVPEVDPLKVRDVWTYFRHQKPALDAPRPRRGKVARVASDGGEAKPGFGVCRLTLSAEECATLAPKRFGPDISLNDLLVSALHLTIARWNADHGRESELIGVTVPLNLRPKDWRFEVVGNVVSFDRIMSTPEERSSPRSLVVAVEAQTRWLRRGIEFVRYLTYPRWVFWLVSQVVLPTAVALHRKHPERDKARSSILLSNLGRIETKVSDFGPGAGAITEFWSSPPVTKPMGVAIVIAISHGRLLMAMRHRLTFFDSRAARSFFELYRQQIFSLNQAEV